jgi:hypothetical protein
MRIVPPVFCASASGADAEPNTATTAAVAASRMIDFVIPSSRYRRCLPS